MTIKKVLTYPDTVLRERAEPVTDLDGKIQQLIDDMADTMYHAPGIGLASNQVGEPCRIIIYDTSPKDEPNDLVVLINPEIIEADGLIIEEEGCLSVIDCRADVKRAARVTVEGVDREGNPVTLKKEGLDAVVLQHERSSQTLVLRPRNNLHKSQDCTEPVKAIMQIRFSSRRQPQIRST
ncbi:MAG: peptide deformylase [Deltaproteobacteria bacterium]|nr:peptide deformylase [Deltaproteobacteria bacterium]